MLFSACSAPQREHIIKSAFLLMMRLCRNVALCNDGVGLVSFPKSEKRSNLPEKPIFPKPHDPAAFTKKTLRPRRTLRFAGGLRAFINHYRFLFAWIHARFTNQGFPAKVTSWKLVLQYIRFSFARFHARFINHCLSAAITSWKLVLQGMRGTYKIMDTRLWVTTGHSQILQISVDFKK